jgi:hypothetical protein
MAKFADGGPLIWEQLPLPYVVAAHVGYEKKTREEKISFRSPMLSFSEALDEAWYFTDRTERKKFEIVPFMDATHFAWKLSGIRAQVLAAGHFRFEYSYSTQNVERFLGSLEVDLLAGDIQGFQRGLDAAIAQQFVRADDTPHVAELIDVVTFLEANSRQVGDDALLTRALDYARRSREWLLRPRDPMEDGRGFSSRFGPNPFLSAAIFAREVRTPAT